MNLHGKDTKFSRQIQIQRLHRKLQGNWGFLLENLMLQPLVTEKFQFLSMNQFVGQMFLSSSLPVRRSIEI